MSFFNSDLINVNFDNTNFTENTWEQPFIIYTYSYNSDYSQVKADFYCHFVPCHFHSRLVENLNDELYQYTFGKNKFPLNLIELGFIKKIFPDCKIILALRHPLDAILSCVLTSFKINEAMANYENLETSALFYDQVFSLFNIYKENMLLNYHSIKYENVVFNFDKEIKKLVSFLGIEYEDSLSEYYITAKNREKISTPSYHQVVQPIYTKSIERYKQFPEIEKIKPLVSKWINEFNY